MKSKIEAVISECKNNKLFLVLTYLVITICFFRNINLMPRGDLQPYFLGFLLSITYTALSIFVFVIGFKLIVLARIILVLALYISVYGIMGIDLLSFSKIAFFPLAMYFVLMLCIAITFLKVDYSRNRLLKNLLCFIENNLLKIVTFSIIIAVTFAYVDYIPYGTKMVVACITPIFLSIMYGFRIDDKVRQVVALGVIIFLCVLNWVYVSYLSYYSGVERNLYQESKYYYQIVSQVLSSNIDDSVKRVAIDKQAQNTKARFIITKNGEEFYYKESGRNTNEYILEEYYFSEKDGINVVFPKIIDSNGNVYQYRYFYANKPFIWIGLSRAITYSIIPDISQMNNVSFMKYHLYERSMNFWLPFWVGYFMILIILHYKTGYEVNIKELAFSYRALEDKNNELVDAKKELEDNNKELRGYQLTHDMLMNQFDRATSIEVSQHLQSLQLGWNGLVEKLIADEVHKLKNELSQFSIQNDSIQKGELLKNRPAEIESKLYEKVLKPYQKTIMDILSNLPNVLDYRVSENSIKEIVEASKASIPTTFERDRSLKSAFIIQDEVSAQCKGLYCLVNKARLSNIIYNVLKNSSTALSLQIIKKLKEGILHKGKIILRYSLKRENDADYLVVTITDNAGGFPLDIVDKVYREPVKSTDKSEGERWGGGTSYVKFFADRMNIDIVAKNICEEDNVIGAVVEIWIPVLSSV